MRDGVESCRWATAEVARIWLQRVRGINRPHVTVWSWLKKLGGVLRVPRPRRPGNDAEGAEKFKQELGAKLEALTIADQAGFHFREGEERLREGVHIVPLPPYSPELNSCEQLWDVLKDVEGFPMDCLNR